MTVLIKSWETMQQEYGLDSVKLPLVIVNELCDKEIFCFRQHDSLYTKTLLHQFRHTWLIHPWMIKKVLVE